MHDLLVVREISKFDSQVLGIVGLKVALVGSDILEGVLRRQF